jgi:hypothetical protein
MNRASRHIGYSLQNSGLKNSILAIRRLNSSAKNAKIVGLFMNYMTEPRETAVRTFF